jgi:anaerobic ribonucleoside-triphosphate reductase activating protein
MTGEDRLRLGARLEDLPVSRLNGPGARWVLWTQGCSLRCTDRCLNPQFLDLRGGWLYSIEQVLQRLDQVRQDSPGLEGVTFLGGEPFDQALPLTRVAQGARARGLSVLVYSGWTWEALWQRGPGPCRDLFEACDLLIDGPFLPEEFSPELRWRGSRNQRLILLSDRYSADEIANYAHVKGVDVCLSGDRLRVSGSQDPELLDGLARRLRSAGFRLRSVVRAEEPRL